MYKTVSRVLLIASTFACGISVAEARQPRQDLWTTGPYFERVATFPVYLNTDIDTETVAEIVDVSTNGRKLVYTDSEGENLGFVDISNPSRPQPAGTVALNGEPASVAVSGRYALVAVNTSLDFVTTSGELVVVDMRSQRIVATHPLSGQPDAVAVSPDGQWAAIAIENERDEDLVVNGEEGNLPQAPGGFLVVVNMRPRSPVRWRMRDVSLAGIADKFPSDAEAEFVDINAKNQVVITLQENNHIIVVDLPSGQIVADWSAGSVNLDQIDTEEDDHINPSSSLNDVPREPDGVTWVGNRYVATADEGDFEGGSRGFTIFDTMGAEPGRVVYSSGNSVEHIVTALGHYPESRSENKGNEPENVEYARFGKSRYLFVGSERSSVVLVYEIRGRTSPKLVQVLPAGVGPEGIKAIPRRNLLVTASEVDARGDKIRSSINIYMMHNWRRAKHNWARRAGERPWYNPNYPTVISNKSSAGTPIPWGALSGLSAHPTNGAIGYSVHDSYYTKSRIFSLDLRRKPAAIFAATELNDGNGYLAAVSPDQVNDDGSVNLDLEGIFANADGSFWVVSEGAGTVGDEDRPVESPNLLLRVAADGTILSAITPPSTTNDRQLRFGFEGVAAVNYSKTGREMVYVVFQRAWADDPAGYARVGRYDVATGTWAFFYYPLDAVASANGGWVGLSAITPIDATTFAVIERDNQAGPDAAVKRVYKFSVAGLAPGVDTVPGTTPSFPIVSKRLVRNLLPVMAQPRGAILEKVEGLALLKNGRMLIVNDNDGVDDSNGETQLFRIRSR